MANPLDSIDPNDLDSIDALLDEAEIESISESESELDMSSETGVSGSPELDSLEDDPTDSLLDDLESELDSVDDLTSTNNSPAEPEPEIVVEPSKPVAPKIQQPEKNMMADAESESFLEKRAAIKTNQQNTQELTVAEMNSIKKLIIIFGSVMIVLALIGITIGVWGALSAGKGLDEESSKMLEDIKVGTQQNTQKSAEATNLVKGVEKKMDALSFQLEQINNDLLELDKRAKKDGLSLDLTHEASQVVDPHAVSHAPVDTHANTGHAVVETSHKVEPMVVQSVGAPMSVVAQPDPEIAAKLAKVSAQIVVAQNRIAEVNKRLKTMQAQYGSLVRSVKTVEKEVISAKVEKAKEKADAEAALQEKAIKKQPTSSYQYSVPGFDYHNNRDGSYP